jgi:HPt (histidine-containing phosphotransfer) domain-containing protein
MLTNSIASEGAHTFNQPNTFDFDAALFNLGGDQDLLQLLVNMVAEDIPVEIIELQSRIAEGQIGEVQLHAHALKGLCATFSVEPMRTLAHDLEMAAKANRPLPELAKVTNQIQSLEQQTVRELRRVANIFLESNH